MDRNIKFQKGNHKMLLHGKSVDEEVAITLFSESDVVGGVMIPALYRDLNEARASFRKIASMLVSNGYKIILEEVNR